MKRPFVVFVFVTVLAFNVPAFQDRGAGANAAQDATIIPLIVMDQVPLADAVKNLFRQMSDPNYTFDPWITPPAVTNLPSISGRWTNMTSKDVVTDILAKQKLKLVANPATTVARIVPAEDSEKPADFSFLTNKGQMIPVIFMDEVPLGEAITNLARQALMLPITLDPKLDAPGSGPGGRRALSESFINFRWKNISAKQALAALLENYGLVLVSAENGAPARIVKAPATK